MRNINILCCSLFTAIVLMSCSTPKMVNLDPITINENAPGLNVYRGSYTRLSDIINTKLDLSFNWDSAYVYGKATIQAKPYFYSSDQITLDANGFRINQINLLTKNEQQPLRYTYNGKKLTITLDKIYTSEQKYTVVIDYVAMPNKLKVGEDISSAGDRGIYFINKDGKDKDKPKQIWTQGETECNSSWFPTINDPQEKMTQEINLTVLNDYVSLSNGTLEYSTLNGNGTRTDSWRQEQPHSTYLTMIAVGNFTVTKEMWREKEVNYYTEPAYASTAKLVFGKTPEMIEFYSNKLGIDYPWDKYSQIVVRDFVSGAMENTTATVFFDRMSMSAGQYLDENHEDIIAHELFHQWFGNLVTAESWSNLPLNESFATYGEYLWEEHKYGRDVADFKGLEDLTTYLSGDRKKNPDVIRFDYADREQMFDEISYQKGGRILHMLRKTVGDSAFFKALNLYLTRNAYKNAEIHHLRLAFEEVSGMDLNWFFNQWFLASGHPILNIQSNYSPDKKEIAVTIIQKQELSKSPLYRIPMAIDIYSDGKVERKEVVLDKQEQTFIFPSQVVPDLVNTDAERYILGEKSEMKTLEQYVFQYRNAPLFMDRFEAIMMLLQMRDIPLAKTAIVEAMKDKNWFIRSASLSVVDKFSSDEQKSVYEQIRNIALKDEVSHVRADAVSILGKVYGTQNNRDIFEITKKDPAPSVVRATEEVVGKE
ncbi:MAG: M1 family aminopeptidase [Daejeonella sp.]|uniref:M1 family metallopeptidase n=1 Tax=Daejeonella sp. TaxID=2805397 RepID=UPI003C725AD1